jgi:hypothetical protein
MLPSTDMGSPPGSSMPQFATAEYAGGGDNCKTCGRAISGRYYRVNGTLACESCAEKLKSEAPKDSHAAFVRGLAFGFGGAILGLILYAAFGIITGLVIGYVSLAVGFIVGKAIKFGSGGMGGRRYQIAAAILTYAAVSTAAIPMGISQYMRQEDLRRSTHRVQPASPADPSADQDSAAPYDAPASKQPGTPPAKPKLGLGAALMGLLFLGLASPFLALQDPFQGAIGLVILFVGIRIAWKLTAGPQLDIVGPFQSRAPAPSATPAP